MWRRSKTESFVVAIAFVACVSRKAHFITLVHLKADTPLLLLSRESVNLPAIFFASRLHLSFHLVVELVCLLSLKLPL